MSAVKSKPFAAGTKVRIVTPKFFVRCGYPLCHEEETDKMIEAKGKDIETFVLAMVRPPLPEGVLPGPNWNRVEDGTTVKIAKALAYESMKARKFGGRTRAIFTKDCPDRADVVATVITSRFVKTGTYVPGRSYATMDGYDYDPPYLEDAKTHRILELEIPVAILDDGIDPWWIEAANVERV